MTIISQSRKNRLYQRIEFLLPLALTISIAGLQLSPWHVPRLLGTSLLLVGVALLAWCMWAVSHQRHPVLGILALAGVFTFCGLMGWLSHREYWKNNQTKTEPPAIASPPSPKNSRTTNRNTSVTSSGAHDQLQELRLVLHNDATIPEFYINNQASRPLSYSSGIATLALPNGSYLVRAEYPNWTCTALVYLPLEKPEPVPASCKLK